MFPLPLSLRSIAPTCSNGVVGVERDEICCVAGCEMCGGAGCKERAELLGLTAEDCCTQRINEPGIYCEDSETAPCSNRKFFKSKLVTTASLPVECFLIFLTIYNVLVPYPLAV